MQKILMRISINQQKTGGKNSLIMEIKFVIVMVHRVLANSFASS